MAQIAVEEMVVEGDDSSGALALRLEADFVESLTRSGVSVMSSAEVARKTEGRAEIKSCDSIVCLKLLGQALDVKYVLRVKVHLAGNSYRATARLFSATAAAGATIALVPIETQSRFCDACTIEEARQMMTRLAEAIRRPIPGAVGPSPPPGPAPTPPTKHTVPAAALAIGVAAAILGTAIIFTASADTKTVPALGGGLIGSGLAASTVGLYLVLDRAPVPAASHAPRGAGVALRF